MGYVSSSLNWQRDTKLADLSGALPLPFQTTTTAAQALEVLTNTTDTTPFKSCLFPSGNGTHDAELMVVRGCSPASVQRPSDPFQWLLSPSAVMEHQGKSARVSGFVTTPTRFPIVTPFPRLLTDAVTPDGHVAPKRYHPFIHQLIVW